jgi:hypothetical protein
MTEARDEPGRRFSTSTTGRYQTQSAACLPGFGGGRGWIVNIGSTASSMGFPPRRLLRLQATLLAGALRRSEGGQRVTGNTISPHEMPPAHRIGLELSRQAGRARL